MKRATDTPPSVAYAERGSAASSGCKLVIPDSSSVATCCTSASISASQSSLAPFNAGPIIACAAWKAQRHASCECPTKASHQRHVVAENDPGDVFTNVRLVDVSVLTQLATHDQRELHLVVQQLGLSGPNDVVVGSSDR